MSHCTKAILVITKNGQKIVKGGALRYNVVLRLKYITCIPAEEGQRVPPCFSFPSYRTSIQNICTPKCSQKMGPTELDKKMLFKFKAYGRKHGKGVACFISNKKNSKGN